MIWWFGGWFTIALTTFFCLWLLWMSQIPMKKHIIMGSWPPKHAKLRLFFPEHRQESADTSLGQPSTGLLSPWCHGCEPGEFSELRLGQSGMDISLTCRNCIKKTLGASTTSRADNFLKSGSLRWWDRCNLAATVGSAGVLSLSCPN